MQILGLRGDGITYAVFAYADDALVEEIEQNENRISFPLEESMTILLYGIAIKTEGAAIGTGSFLPSHAYHFEQLTPGTHKSIPNTK